MARRFVALSEAARSIGNGFDPESDLKRNPDVAAAGADPYRHFLAFGIAEGGRFDR